MSVNCGNKNHLCDSLFSNCANPLERMSGQFIWDRKTLSIKKSPLFCLNSMRLSAFYLICTLFFIWRHTGFSAFFFVHKHFLVDLFREKKLFFLFLALLRFYCPKQTTQKHTFLQLFAMKKKLFSSAFGALFFLPSFIRDKFKFCFYWPSWSLRISLYLTAFIIFVSKVESTI